VFRSLGASTRNQAAWLHPRAARAPFGAELQLPVEVGTQLTTVVAEGTVHWNVGVPPFAFATFAVRLIHWPARTVWAVQFARIVHEMSVPPIRICSVGGGGAACTKNANPQILATVPPLNCVATARQYVIPADKVGMFHPICIGLPHVGGCGSCTQDPLLPPVGHASTNPDEPKFEPVIVIVSVVPATGEPLKLTLLIVGASATGTCPVDGLAAALPKIHPVERTYTPQVVSWTVSGSVIVASMNAPLGSPVSVQVFKVTVLGVPSSGITWHGLTPPAQNPNAPGTLPKLLPLIVIVDVPPACNVPVIPFGLITGAGPARGGNCALQFPPWHVHGHEPPASTS
jgi:hypothetical protein